MKRDYLCCAPGMTRTYKVPEQPVVLDQQRCVYLPRVLTLMKGQRLA